jgi:hypothetical protein
MFTVLELLLTFNYAVHTLSVSDKYNLKQKYKTPIAQHTDLITDAINIPLIDIVKQRSIQIILRIDAIFITLFDLKIPLIV